MAPDRPSLYHQLEFTISRSHEYFKALLRPRVLPVVRRILVLSVVSALVGPLMIVVSEGEGVGTVLGFLCIVAAPGFALRVRRVYAVASALPDGWD